MVTKIIWVLKDQDVQKSSHCIITWKKENRYFFDENFEMTQIASFNCVVLQFLW